MIGEIGELIGWFNATLNGWRYLFSASYRVAKSKEWKNEKSIYKLCDISCGLVGIVFSIFLIYQTGIWLFTIYLSHENPKGFKNLELCKTIKKGINFEEIVNILGNPVNESVRKDGTWYYFNTSSIAAGLISVMGSKENNVVFELRCSEDGPSDWNINIQ